MPGEGSRVIKSGYLVKSPPLEGASKLLPKRWMLRWFVLYDCRGTEGYKEAERALVGYGYKLLYFKDHRSCSSGESPIGEINMNGSSVRTLGKALHGYRYAIKLKSQSRKYFLCTTCEEVYRAWLDKLQSSLIQPKQVDAASEGDSRIGSLLSEHLPRSPPASVPRSGNQNAKEFINYGRTQFVRINTTKAQQYSPSGLKAETLPGHRGKSAKPAREEFDKVTDDDLWDSADTPMLEKQNLRFTVSKIPCLPDEDRAVGRIKGLARDSGFISSDEDSSPNLSRRVEARTRTRFGSEERILTQTEKILTARRRSSTLPLRYETGSRDLPSVKPRSESAFTIINVPSTLLSEDDSSPSFTGPRLKSSLKSLSKSATDLATRADSFLQALPPGAARESLMMQFKRVSRLNPSMFDGSTLEGNQGKDLHDPHL